VHQSCKFGEIPTSSLYHANKLITDACMDSLKTARLWTGSF